MGNYFTYKAKTKLPVKQDEVGPVDLFAVYQNDDDSRYTEYSDKKLREAMEAIGRLTVPDKTKRDLAMYCLEYPLEEVAV